MKGRKLYDPRAGLTARSDNPALVIYDYHRGPSEEDAWAIFHDRYNKENPHCGVIHGERYTSMKIV